jgi:hypothetical protein
MDMVQEAAVGTETAMGTDLQRGFHFILVPIQHVANFVMIDGRLIV